MADYAPFFLIIGGIYHLFFVFFQLTFWRGKLLNWREELPRMSSKNRFVIQMCNLAVIVCKFLFAYISLFYTHELLNPGLGKTLLWGIGLFWLARLAGEFILQDSVTKVGIVASGIGIFLYLLPALLI